MNEYGKIKEFTQIDIDPSEVNKNVEVDYSLVGDVKQILQALLPVSYTHLKRVETVFPMPLGAAQNNLPPPAMVRYTAPAISYCPGR